MSVSCAVGSPTLTNRKRKTRSYKLVYYHCSSAMNKKCCHLENRFGREFPDSFCLLATSMKEDCIVSRPVTLLACTARRMQSSKSCVRYISAASCIALRALVWKRRPWIPLLDASWVAISRTTLPNGRHGIRRLVDFWYFRISIKALITRQV